MGEGRGAMGLCAECVGIERCGWELWDVGMFRFVGCVHDVRSMGCQESGVQILPFVKHNAPFQCMEVHKNPKSPDMVAHTCNSNIFQSFLHYFAENWQTWLTQ